MRKKITIVNCDVCKSEILKEERDVDLVLAPGFQTIFITEQTEGSSCKPYLYMSHLDLCNNCNNKLLEGNYIWGHGAQGHNTYYFKDKK